MDGDSTVGHDWLDRSSPLSSTTARPSPRGYDVRPEKAAQRLPNRRVHPLLYTGQQGPERFIPSTSLSAASPDYTAASAAQIRPRKGSILSPAERAQNRNVDMHPASAIEPNPVGWTRWHDTGSRVRTDSSGLRASRSVSEGMRGLRERLAWQHEHGGTYPVPEPSWEEIPHPQDMTVEGVRESFKSAMTSNSSCMDSYASTERSSMATGYSSASDFVKVYPGSPVAKDEDFSVEDAIGMYCDGFETPPRRSIDTMNAERSPERPSSSPAQRQNRPKNTHRRSRSAVGMEGAPMYETGHPTLAPPVPFLARPPNRLSDSGEKTPKLLTGSSNTESSSPGDVATVPAPARDRYGFKKVSLHVTLEQYDGWERTYNEHLDRRKAKWQTVMRQFGLSTEAPTRFPPKSERIKRYVRKGIPPEWRGAAWFWYAGGPGLQKKHEGVYFNLLHRIKTNGELKETDQEHIERDLNRTFPDNVTFKPDLSPASSEGASFATGMDTTERQETQIIAALRRVLQAFAVHRPGIGYCQSLNFIAGLLLLFLDQDEEKSFLLLNVITSDFLPGTHGVSLEGANIDIAVLMQSLKEMMPTVWQKLDDRPATTRPSPKPDASPVIGPLSLPTVSLATTPWFLTLYLTTLPVETALRIWDVLFLEGPKTLFRAALSIFKLCEGDIRATSDSMEVFQILQTTPRGLLDCNALMELCFRRRGGFGGLSQDTVERRRDDLRRKNRGAVVAPLPGGRSLTARPDGDGPPKDEKKGVGASVRGRFRSRTKGAQG